MRKLLLICALALFAINLLWAQNITVSGILDSSVSLQVGAGNAPVFSFGIEEFANIRFQSRIRDRAAVYGAVNLLAASGDYAANAGLMASVAEESPFGVTAYTAGNNYIAAIELERLYFRLNGDYVDFEGGLMRLPFGYGQIWGPSDFLNPKNPLKPDARLRGILGASVTWFSADELKLLAFYAAPRRALSREGNGTLVGLSLDKHWEKVSVQALYSFQTSDDSSRYGIHRAGFSLKAEIEASFMLEALYTYNHEAGTKIDGLSLSIGADYSFFDGNLIVLAEYLYSGETSSTGLKYGGGFSNRNYLYTGLTWRFNDFTNLSAALISCFDDISFTPIFTFNHELFQGATLTVTAQIPLDRDLFSGDGNRGELGPLRPVATTGSYFNFGARLRLRF